MPGLTDTQHLLAANAPTDVAPETRGGSLVCVHHTVRFQACPSDTPECSAAACGAEEAGAGLLGTFGRGTASREVEVQTPARCHSSNIARACLASGQTKPQCSPAVNWDFTAHRDLARLRRRHCHVPSLRGGAGRGLSSQLGREPGAAEIAGR